MATRLLLILLLLLGIPTVTTAAETHHGRVVDAETKKALEGAVVTVIWMKAPFGDAEGVSDFHAARETLTNADGRLSIDAKPPSAWNPFRPVQRPEIIVFKPGYGRYADMYYWLISWPGKTLLAPVEEPLQKGRFVTIELPRLTTQHDPERFARPSLHPRVPYERVPIYLKLVNEYAVSLGLTPLPVPK